MSQSHAAKKPVPGPYREGGYPCCIWIEWRSLQELWSRRILIPKSKSQKQSSQLNTTDYMLMGKADGLPVLVGRTKLSMETSKPKHRIRRLHRPWITIKQHTTTRSHQEKKKQININCLYFFSWRITQSRCQHYHAHTKKPREDYLPR